MNMISNTTNSIDVKTPIQTQNLSPFLLDDVSVILNPNRQLAVTTSHEAKHESAIHNDHHEINFLEGLGLTSLLNIDRAPSIN